MTLKVLKLHFANSLFDFYPETEITSFFFLLTECFLGKRRIDVVLDYDEIISEINISKFNNAIARLKAYEPIQYIIGETEFYNLPFKVNSSVLIPRPETEELVSLVLKNSNHKTLNLLDIGTGSGCIAISLAKNLPKANVFALDVSKEALIVAKENAKLNNVEIEFIKGDILKSKDLMQKIEDFKFDIIVSNPPYVRTLEKDKMSTNVLNHEPHVALLVEDNDPLLFYKKIIQFANKTLRGKGLLFFEINEYLGKDMIMLIKDEGFIDVELKSDVFGKDRMIKGVKP